MPEANNNPLTFYEQGWFIRVQTGPTDSTHAPLLLLHGWTGDENSMWLFTRGLTDRSILAPRGPIPAQNGYGWVPTDLKALPDYAAYLPIAQSVQVQLDIWLHLLSLPSQPFSVVGFSQGAALALVLCALYPDRFSSLSLLAGYLPDGNVNHLANLKSLPVFIAHGTQDETIPIASARKLSEALRQAGAHLTYCEDEVGHKLGASCFNGLKAFLKES